MSIRLYLVEDDQAISRMLSASLSRYGFEITAHEDGQAALDQFDGRQFDVALVDVGLPNKDGFQVAMGMRASPGGNQLGIVLMSAHAQSPDVVLKMRRAQVDAWMNKPLRMRELRDKLAELAHKYTGATSEMLRKASTRSALREKKPTTGETERKPVSDLPRPTPVPRPRERSGPTPVAPAARPAPAASRPAPAAATRVPDPPAGAATTVKASDARDDVLGETPVPIDGIGSVPRAMLDAARQHRTGVLHLKHREAEAKVAYLAGIMVGASENSPDHRLLTRLVRRGVLELEDITKVRTYSHENNLRAAEAVLAMERCDAATLFDELTKQASDRLTLAAGWTEGEMWFDEAREPVELLAISSFDAFEVIQRRFDRFSDRALVDRWLATRGDEPVRTSKDFEDGLVAYARIAPTSPLPGVLFMNPANLREIASVCDSQGGDQKDRLRAHVYGMWVAGMLRLAKDPRMDERPVPRPLKSDDVEAVVPDQDAVAQICGEWLRAQGRSFYDVLGVERDVEETALWEAIGTYSETYGRLAFEDKKLGLVEGLAEELWALIDDITSTLTDAEMRAAYDEITAPEPEEEEAEEGFADAAMNAIDAETAYLAGRIALQSGDLQQARACFGEAAEFDPDHVEYASHLAWLDFLEAAEQIDGVLAKLKAAAHDHPKSMRPLLMLGLAAERLGFPAAARDPLREALHRCPDDPEVMAAIMRVEQLGTSEE